MPLGFCLPGFCLGVSDHFCEVAINHTANVRYSGIHRSTAAPDTETDHYDIDVIRPFGHGCGVDGVRDIKSAHSAEDIAGVTTWLERVLVRPDQLWVAAALTTGLLSALLTAAFTATVSSRSC